MYLIASFEQTIFLEIALKTLEQQGIRKGQILAVPLDKGPEARRVFDTMHYADGYSLFDVAAVLATCGMLLGAIYGFVLEWGPILWGIIGFIAGAALGLLLKYIFMKKQKVVKKANALTAEVFIMIDCLENQCEWIERVLWDNHALGIAKLRQG
ncbi:hypothetical protein [Paenibacillus silvisoli]|uniref:hypothetical protein n=1 Tax=Paenibacillus silvisoli TaxID=3110539 RepID=UPI0028050FCD|nr:hypothetical protein [Paenibacillus silvisoli]